MLATAGIAGRFADAVCAEGRTLEPSPVTSFTTALLARAAGEVPAMVVDTGGLLAPHGVLRFASDAQPDEVATLVTELGYQALAFGEDDLGAPRARTLAVAGRLRERGVPYVASNLRCDTAARALCDSVVDSDDEPLAWTVGDGRAAFLAMLDPRSLARMAPDRAAGVHLRPLLASLPEQVRRARAGGASLVVAVLEATSDDAFSLARDLPEDARPDLILLSGAGDQLLFARPRSFAPALVSPPPGGGVDVLVRQSDALRTGFELLATPLAGEGPAPAAPVEAFTRAVGPAYCAKWGEPLPGGRLTRSISADDVARLAAQIVREFASADVSFLNVGAIDSAFDPGGRAQLIGSDLYVAIAYDEPLVVADVDARWLLDAAVRLEDHGVVSPGLSLVPDEDAEEGAVPEIENLRVRNRHAVPGASYRVATLRFLAEGGDGALPPLPAGSSWRTLERTLPDGRRRYRSLREIVLDALERPSLDDPRDARPSPDAPPEWVVRGSIDGDFAGSSVSNPAGYDAAQLATEQAIALGAEIDLHADATAPAYTWENRWTGRYRTQWSPATEPGSESTFVEAADQLQLRSMLSYRGLRATPGEVWVPDAYVEAFVESEWTRPDTRAWHWLLVRPTVGARFPLTSLFDVKLQLGVQGQALDPTARAELGAGASVLLRPWVLLEQGERALTVEGTADFFAVNLLANERWQLRAQLDASLDLVGPLALTFGANLYMQQDAAASLGLAFSATAGLRVAAVTRTIGP